MNSFKFFFFQAAFVVVSIHSIVTRAAIFDSSDFLRQNDTTLGSFGELVLSEPTSEGIEFHARHGWDSDWNLGAVFGSGGRNMRLRTGLEATYGLVSDEENIVGVSFLGSLLYLRRDVSGGLYSRIAPMVHTRVTAWNGMPGVLFFGVPLSFEVRSGKYTTASSLSFGGVMDVSSHSEFYMVAEAGIKISRGESIVALGAGYRFGAVDLHPKEKKYRREHREEVKEDEEEYRSEDFQKR